jgi:hypothetical protein
MRSPEEQHSDSMWNGVSRLEQSMPWVEVRSLTIAKSHMHSPKRRTSLRSVYEINSIQNASDKSKQHHQINTSIEARYSASGIIQ